MQWIFSRNEKSNQGREIRARKDKVVRRNQAWVNLIQKGTYVTNLLCLESNGDALVMMVLLLWGH